MCVEDPFSQIQSHFVLDGVLYYESNDVPGRQHLVVPEQLRDKVVTKNHDRTLKAMLSKLVVNKG